MHLQSEKIDKVPDFKIEKDIYKLYPLNGRYLMEVENLHRQYPPGCIDVLLSDEPTEPYREFLESDRYAALREEESILTICAYLRREFDEFDDYYQFKNLWDHIEPLLPLLEHGISWEMSFTCPTRKKELRDKYPPGAVNAMITKKSAGFEEFFKSDEFAALREAERALGVALPLPFRTLNKLSNM